MKNSLLLLVLILCSACGLPSEGFIQSEVLIGKFYVNEDGSTSTILLSPKKTNEDVPGNFNREDLSSGLNVYVYDASSVTETEVNEYCEDLYCLDVCLIDVKLDRCLIEMIYERSFDDPRKLAVHRYLLANGIPGVNFSFRETVIEEKGGRVLPVNYEFEAGITVNAEEAQSIAPENFAAHYGFRECPGGQKDLVEDSRNFCESQDKLLGEEN